MAQLVFLILNRWIVIYPVDSVIQRLNNQGLDGLDRPNVQPMYSLQFKGLRWPQTPLHGIKRVTEGPRPPTSRPSFLCFVQKG